jgi:hypothetical protein
MSMALIEPLGHRIRPNSGALALGMAIAYTDCMRSKTGRNFELSNLRLEAKKWHTS